MDKKDIIKILKDGGFTDKQIREKHDGIEVIAEKRVPAFEFDYDEFVNTFRGKLDLDLTKVHFLDPWTFTIECL